MIAPFKKVIQIWNLKKKFKTEITVKNHLFKVLMRNWSEST